MLILDATPAAPPLVAPLVRPAFNPGNGALTIRYDTIPGLRYRVHGGNSIHSFTPLTGWSSGLGIEQEFSAGPAVTSGASQFFLRLEVRPN